MADKHVYIFGEIGWENNVQSVQSQIGNATSEDTIIVHIHSPGGDVNEGFAIHDHLLSYGATVETRIEGLCASIATIIALAGSKRTITENSNFFVHNPWTMAQGDADQMMATAEQLKAVEERIAEFYSKRTDKEKEYMLQLMSEAGDINPDKALNIGFVTEVVKPVLAMAKYTNPANQQSINKLEQIMSNFLTKIEARMNKILGIQNNADEPKNYSTTLEDGTAIFIDTDQGVPVVGAAVTIEETGEPAPDGGHTLADGYSIIVVDGVITDVMETPEPDDIDALKAENADLKAKVEELTGSLQTVEAKFDEFVKNLEQKQPMFNRAQRKPAPGKTEKPADRTGGKDAIKARLETKKTK
jgi:ATP-dependent protease ClpP protease subunit